MTPKIGDTLNSDLSISLLGSYDSIDIVIVPEELNGTAVNGIASGGSISSIDNTVDSANCIRMTLAYASAPECIILTVVKDRICI